jgi:hypothetical protein
LNFISQLRPVTYVLDAAKLMSAKDKAGYPDIVSTGFIAQEVDAAARRIGYDFDGVGLPTPEVDLYTLDYAKFVPSIVKAINEQQQSIAELTRQLSKRSRAFDI